MPNNNEVVGKATESVANLAKQLWAYATENATLRKENQRLRDILAGMNEYEFDAGLPKIGPQEVEWKHEETE